jgi:lactate dehydrogenase-like 2-hydroxyacid dehydrogenase
MTGHQAFLTNEALQDIALSTLQSFNEFEQGKRGKELSFNFVY